MSMVGNMRSKRAIRSNKRGSYIVEAAIVVPIFIMAVIMLISIIPIIATCENITFSAADEMHFEDAKSAFRKNPAAYPLSLKARESLENKRMKAFHVTGYNYLYGENGISDLIAVSFKATFSEKNPIGLFSSVRFSGHLVSRAFTGSYYNDQPESRSEFEKNKDSELVYIFPNWGYKYHNKNCSYVKANCHLVYLSQDVRNKYHPCPLCNAGKAELGTPVFCFENSGEAYHLGNCSSVDKYYVEIEKDDAVKKGYTPCSKCGG